MRNLIVEPRAGIPLLMNPLNGHCRDVQDFSPVVTEHIAPLPTTDGTTSLVADSTLDREENLQKLVEMWTTWRSRVPATVSVAPAVLGQADPPTMTPLLEGYRSQQAIATPGGMPQCWLLVYSDHCHPQALRLV